MKKDKRGNGNISSEQVDSELVKLKSPLQKVEYLKQLLEKRNLPSQDVERSITGKLETAYGELGAEYFTKYLQVAHSQGDHNQIFRERKDFLDKAVKSYSLGGHLPAAVNLLAGPNADLDIAVPLYEKYSSLLKSQGKVSESDIGIKLARGEYYGEPMLTVIEEVEKQRHSQKGLEKTVATSAAIGLIGGSFFLSANVTGNVIGLSNTTSSWIGGILILIGLIALGFWIKSRKDNKKVVVQKVSKSVKKKKK